MAGFFTQLLLVAAALLPQNACAAKSLPQSTTTFSTQFCSTEFGPSKTTSPVPRTTIASTTHSHISVTSTVTPTTVVTPATSTSTTTTTVTTTTTTAFPIVTDTATVTTTYTSTQTATTTSTATANTVTTITVTSNIASTTIAEAPGFTAIKNEPAVSGGGTKRKRTTHAVDARPEVDGPIRERSGLYKLSPSLPKNGAQIHGAVAAKSPSSYATQVVCSRTVTLVTMTYTTTAAATSTSTAPTPIITSTATATATSTQYETDPDATTTVTASITIATTTTLTQSTTITNTASTTTTSIVAATTTYAVCEDSANYISYLNGVSIATLQPVRSYSQGSATTAHDCCVECSAMNGCGVSAFSSVGICYLITQASSCDPTQVDAQFVLDNNDYAFVISNTNCGQADPPSS